MGKGAALTGTARVFGLAATYVGTVIGAGFASGQEIWVFFGRFGGMGFAGLLLSGLLFALAGERVLSLGRQGGRTKTYFQTLQSLFGPVAPLLDAVLLVFLCVLSGVMLAGSGALARTFGWPAWTVMTATAALGVLVVAADMPGIVTVNKLVVPCLILVTALIACGALERVPCTTTPAPHIGWLPAALLYVSYNIVLSLPVLAALGAAEPDRRVLRAGSIWGAAGLFLTGSLILSVLLRQSICAPGVEVPMAVVASSLGKPVGLAYSFILWAEMFTTLIADVYGASVRLGQLFRGRRAVWAGATMVLGLCLSRMGFARLVRTAYPAFGLICLVVLIRLFWPARHGGSKERSSSPGSLVTRI